MADDTFLVSAHVSRRDRLIAARRRRRRRVIVVFAIVLLVGGSATAFALTRDHDTAPGTGSAAPAAKVASGDAPTVPQVESLDRTPPPRTLTHDAPLEVWIGGDSLAGAIGPALGELAGATGVVHTQVDYKV